MSKQLLDGTRKQRSYKVVGTSRPKVDAYGKVTGTGYLR